MKKLDGFVSVYMRTAYATLRSSEEQIEHWAVRFKEGRADGAFRMYSLKQDDTSADRARDLQGSHHKSEVVAELYQEIEFVGWVNYSESALNEELRVEVPGFQYESQWDDGYNYIPDSHRNYANKVFSICLKTIEARKNKQRMRNLLYKQGFVKSLLKTEEDD